MATVTDEDRELSFTVFGFVPGSPERLGAIVAYRERIEARVRAECVAAERARVDNACEQLDAIADAIGLTKHEREVTQQSVLDVVRELVAHDEMNAKACRDKDKRIAELDQCYRDSNNAHVMTLHELDAAKKRIADFEAKLKQDTDAWRAERQSAMNHGLNYERSLKTAQARIAELEQQPAQSREYNRTTTLKSAARVGELEAQLSAIRTALHMDANSKAIPADLIRDMEMDRDECAARADQWFKFASEVTGSEGGAVNVRMLQHAIRVGLRVEAGRAAKPVLTAEDDALLREYRSLLRVPGTITTRMIDLLDRLCPPPKAPPTLDELASTLHTALFTTGDVRDDIIRKVHDELRARCGNLPANSKTCTCVNGCNAWECDKL